MKKVEFIFTEINTRYLYKNNALVSDIDKYLEKFGFFRIFTNVDCFNYFGDAFYIKETNKLYSQNTLNKIKNKLYISNLFLHFKKLSYPRRLTKSLLRK